MSLFKKITKSVPEDVSDNKGLDPKTKAMFMSGLEFIFELTDEKRALLENIIDAAFIKGKLAGAADITSIFLETQDPNNPLTAILRSKVDEALKA